MTKAYFLGILCFVSSVALAEPKAKPLEVVGLSSSKTLINLAQVQQQVTLVQSVRDDSNLRVSFVVVDQGGSTDVSPKAALYLTTFLYLLICLLNQKMISFVFVRLVVLLRSPPKQTVSY